MKLADTLDLGSNSERNAGSSPVGRTNNKSPDVFGALNKCEDNKMSQLNTYRNTLLPKKDENAKLYQDLAKEQSKIAPLQQKIISAKSAISRTSNQSTIKSKLKEIERSNRAISDIQKKISDIQKKIAQKEKDIANAEKIYRNEEIRVNKKQADKDEKRMQDIARQSQEFEYRIQRNETLQAKMQLDIRQLKAIPEMITVLF